MEWYYALLLGMLVGFVVGVLFRDAWTMFQKAIKEYNEEAGDAVATRGFSRFWMWVVVSFFSLMQIALGVGIIYAVTDSVDTQNCLVDVAAASRDSRGAAIAWVEDFNNLVKDPPDKQADARKAFFESSETYLNRLRELNKTTNRCLPEES